MSKFNKGDKVRVRLNSDLPSKGSFGTVDEDFHEGSS
jgi:hypothetical protein